MSDDPVAENAINVMDPLDALDEPQRTSAKKARSFIRSLQKIRPPSKNSDIFVGRTSSNGVSLVQMFAREGLFDVNTIKIEVPANGWDYRKLVARLAEEYAELHKALFLKTFAPDLYNGDMSPVELTESKTVKSMDLM